MGLINNPRGVWNAILGRLQSKVLGDGVVRTKAFPSSSTGGQPYSPQTTSSGGTVHSGGAVSLSSSSALSATGAAIRMASGSVSSSAALAGAGNAIRKASGSVACGATLTATGVLVSPNGYQWRARGTARGGWRRGRR